MIMKNNYSILKQKVMIAYLKYFYYIIVLIMI